ncbi:hypothetical protein [Thermoanaerobacter wiegelii]|uniref:Uncharacterized protein n=1 Tax=Thermoanaerobacter wiegelii Rt8.B1 TaxID=697303 RepID=G2MX87_9THEO|nr:hypothetical protein [Thermoanaerobacter wiegelii]AEM78374.1 hypothetical protein Thewi_0945 [Thermoanaerobacter wiegelii Rt8.B1]
MSYDYAYRRIKTSSTGYRKIEATITLPSLNDVALGIGAALYEYVGCDSPTFDFEFGFGLTGESTQYHLYRSIYVGGNDWQWISGYTFEPGSTYRLLIAAEDGYIKCYVYNSSGTLLYYNEFTVRGIRYDGLGKGLGVSRAYWFLQEVQLTLIITDGQTRWLERLQLLLMLLLLTA